MMKYLTMHMENHGEHKRSIFIPLFYSFGIPHSYDFINEQ